MQILFMYLALFLATILATTTDAAPRGLKKNDDSASLVRMLMGSKDGGGNTAVDDVMQAGCVDERPLVKFANAESACLMLEVFDNMGRDENNGDGDGLRWNTLCDDFDPLDKFLCPTEEAVAAICSAKFPDENPAVKKNWCIPRYGMIDDSEACIASCVNYVSAPRGGCCDIDCGGGM